MNWASLREADYSLASNTVIQWCTSHRSEHYYRMMARSTVVPTRIDARSMRPTGRQRASHSSGSSRRVWLLHGSEVRIMGPTAHDAVGRCWVTASAVGTASDQPSAALTAPAATSTLGGAAGGRRSVRSGQGQHLRPLALGKAAPDAIGLMYLQGVGPAGCHRRTFEANGLGLCFASGPGRSPFALRMEKERTRHPAARCMQLPIPQVCIWARKAPGVSHIDPLGCLQRCINQRSVNQIYAAQISKPPTEPGIWARSAPHTNQRKPDADKTSGIRPDLPRWSRIRTDPGAVVDQTLERFSSFDKSLIMFFVDLDRAVSSPVQCAESTTVPRPVCALAHTPEPARTDFGGWRLVVLRLLCVVNSFRYVRHCPKDPLWGPYRCFVDDQGSVGSAVASPQLPSTSSAGGVT